MPRPGSRPITSIRNRIIHEYAEIDTKIVQAIGQNEVPRLLEKSEAHQEELGHGG